MTKREAKDIIINTCGNPPRIEALKHSIELNSYKKSFYTKHPLDKDLDKHKENLRMYQTLIDTANEFLKKSIQTTLAL